MCFPLTSNNKSKSKIVTVFYVKSLDIINILRRIKLNMKLTFLAELLCTPLFSLWPLLNHQLSECLASIDVYHRSIADPLPCQKPMRGKKEQQNSNT